MTPKAWILPATALLLLLPETARAHCDTLDGPVVAAARTALESGKLAPVLAWVKPDDEREIRAAFDQARSVRKLGADARALADRYFFETLVRVHRGGEGAPYTGLRPAGEDLGPAVAAADRAVATGSAEKVEQLLVEEVRRGVRARFAALKERRPPADDVAAGRAWVEAYVPWVHYVEGVHDVAARASTAHAGHGAAAAPEDHRPEGGHREPGAHAAHAH
jgi:hypothetical protein